MSTAQMGKGCIGFGNVSSCIGRAAAPTSTRIQGAAYVSGGAYRVYGDEASTEFWINLEIPTGTTTPTVDHLEPEYEYVWNINRHKLTVKNNVGNIIVLRDVYTIADLMIDVEIATSHQFIIIVDSDSMGSGYLTAARQWTARGTTKAVRAEGICQASKNIGMAAVSKTRLVDGMKGETAARVPTMRNSISTGWLEAGEQYLDPTIKPDSKRVYMWQNDNGETIEISESYALYMADLIASILWAKVKDLSADGFYPTNLAKGTQGVEGRRVRKILSAQMMRQASYLMVYRIAVGCVLTSKPVFEPWMLANTWSWMYRCKSPDDDERIPDLSPFW